MRAKQNQEGDDDIPYTVTVYPFLAKYTTPLFKTTQQRYIGGLYASLRYIEGKLAVEGTTKPRGGYRYTVYRHGILISGKNTISLFILTLVFYDVRVFR